MPLNTNGRNAAVAGLAGGITHVAIHSGIPDATGSGESSSARVAVTWATAASGGTDNTNQLTHSMPAGSTGAAYGFWSASTSGNFLGWAPIVGSGGGVAGYGTVDSAGVTGNLIQSAAHGLSNGDRVVLTAVLAESLPTGLNATTMYFVVGVTTNTFQVSLTSGGAAVDITGQGELFFQNIVPETFANAGTLVTAIGALDLSIQQ